MSPKRTPLTGIHEGLGARIIEFAGFHMPVSYTSILEEHQAVRERIGLFDVSHMGEFFITGPNAGRFVDELVTNDCRKLAPGGVLYTVMCRDDGTVVDDLLVYLIGGGRNPEYMLVVNAANIEKDFSHISAHVSGGVSLENMSDAIALIAVQGPASLELLGRCPFFAPAMDGVSSLEYYHFMRFEREGETITVSRTGYTGERGFELFIPPRFAAGLWSELMQSGAPLGIKPVGLAARDTLRFEASFCLYGHELDDRTTPLEAGLSWVVKLDKESFIGKRALAEEKKKRPKRKLAGFELEGRNIARQGFRVFCGGRHAGAVTSGTYSPTLKKSLCMALVENDPSSPAGAYEIEIRNAMMPAQAVALPFYKSRAKG
ncbi:MAG: glycine cleavage system aminomethyltransferase GcvT [Chitinivibrionia bacterium]|nr:glycine cleavage system aminomethyltransferase GcvT [Chitinivibrionia bacterium]